MSRLIFSVGCDRYQKLDPLSGAEQDAGRVHALLTGDRGNYDPRLSRLILSSSLPELMRELNETLFAIPQIDVLTFVFAGHGGVKSGSYYLCLADADNTRLSTTALLLTTLLAVISEVRPRQANIIIDACQSGGAMLDMAPLMKSELLGEDNSLSISFLAACAPNQYAYEENQAGLATTELVKYLIGEKRLHDSRPFLDLVELGRAISTDVQQIRADQTPVTWGINLYGPGEFANNPFYSSAARDLPLPVDTILPNSDVGRVVRHHADALWTESRLLVSDPSHRRLIDLLQTICNEIEAGGESSLPFMRGIATSLSARAGSSPDLLAESDVLSCCMVALLPLSRRDDTQSLIGEVIRERAHFDRQARAVLGESLRQDRFALLSDTGGLGDLYYLPLRLSKILGWLASTALADHLLGAADEADRRSVRELSQAIVDGYAASIVAMSDEQAPYIYIFAKACQLFGWDELARGVLARLFDSIMSVKGAVTVVELNPTRTYDYLILRSYDTPDHDFELIANPSQFIASLLLSGGTMGMAPTWDERLSSLDGRSINFFLPDDYLEFGSRRIRKGRNYYYRIGHGIWTVDDVTHEFKAIRESAIDPNGSLVSPAIKVLCILASYLFPNRIPYFLESGTDIHSS